MKKSDAFIMTLTMLLCLALTGCGQKTESSSEGSTTTEVPTAMSEPEFVMPERNHQTIAAGMGYTVAVNTDGSVFATGDNQRGQCNVYDWADIVAVDAGHDFILALRADGTVVSTKNNVPAVRGIAEWKNIIDVAVGGDTHTVGVRADGTVIATGASDYGECDVDSWTNIVAVSAGDGHTVGLRSDGTVIATGGNDHGECDVNDWTDIVAISAGEFQTIGLRADGTVVAAGCEGLSVYQSAVNVGDWSDIVAIDSYWDTVGLRANGTVVVSDEWLNSEVSNWTNIVDVCIGNGFVLGLRADGTLVAAGDNVYGQCNVSDWTDIRLPNGQIPESSTPAETAARSEQEPAAEPQLAAFLGLWEDTAGENSLMLSEENLKHYINASFYRMVSFDAELVGINNTDGSLIFQSEDGAFTCNLFLNGSTITLTVDTTDEYFADYFQNREFVYGRLGSAGTAETGAPTGFTDYIGSWRDAEGDFMGIYGGAEECVIDVSLRDRLASFDAVLVSNNEPDGSWFFRSRTVQFASGEFTVRLYPNGDTITFTIEATEEAYNNYLGGQEFLFTRKEGN